MDAAARAVHNLSDPPRGAASLRLRHAPVGDPVDSVVETFLGGEPGVLESALAAHAASCGHSSCEACVPSPVEFKPLRMRCPQAASVVIGVEPTGRVCLEVQVGAGVGVSRVLGELEEAERWLRSSAHHAAMAPVGGRMDMSVPVRRCVVLNGSSIAPGSLTRAGIEVRSVGEGREKRN